MLKPLLIFLVFVISTQTHASLFGSRNYEECVLEKMKGQNSNMRSFAVDACLKLFPREELIDGNKIKAEWCESKATSQTYCVTIPKNIKITRAEALFFSDDCNAKQSKAGVKSEAEKSMFSDKFIFKTVQGTYKCSQTWFYGHEK
jgi:hypothetical protein